MILEMSAGNSRLVLLLLTIGSLCLIYLSALAFIDSRLFTLSILPFPKRFIDRHPRFQALFSRGSGSVLFAMLLASSFLTGGLSVLLFGGRMVSRYQIDSIYEWIDGILWFNL